MLRPGSIRKAQVPVIASKVICEVHNEQEVKLYCKNCNFLLCKDCIDEHEDHTLCGLKDIVEDKRQQVTKILDKIENETIPEVKKILQKTKREKSEHSKHETTLINDINKRADFLVSEINKIRHEFIQEIHELQTNEQKNLTEFELKLSEVLSDAEELVVTYRKELKSSRNAQLIKIGLYLDQKVKEIDREINDVPKLKMGSFKAGTTKKESIKSLFGRCLDKEQCKAETSSDILPPQPIGHVIETKLEVVSSFHHETDKGEIRAIATLDDQSAWIATYDGTDIKRVNQTGKVDKTLTFTTDISDIAITDDGSLLVTPNGGSDGHQYQIKKVKSNGDIVTFVDMKPLRPHCICVSKTGHLYVGCIDGGNFDVTDNNTRSVMKLSGTGIVQQSYQYDSNEQRLFTLPSKIQENINGDIWVKDRTAQHEGRIVVIQQDGKVKFIYTGVKNDKITRKFYPCDLTAVGNGAMLIIDTYNNIIHVIDENGTLLYFLGSQHKTGICGPASICLNRKNNMLWVGNTKGEIQILRLK